MPQFRRKVAFSNKKKKEQLKAKRQEKQFKKVDYEGNEGKGNGDLMIASGSAKSRKILQNSNRNQGSFLKSLKYGSGLQSSNRPTAIESYYFESNEEIIGGGSSSKYNRYNLKFKKTETDTKKFNNEPIVPVPSQNMEVSSSDFYPQGLDYPKRPLWKKNITKFELEQSENRYFRLFCEDLDKNFSSNDLSLYELNLETWRQLWRVTEMSDILLLIVDARYAVAQFPPYLYQHLTEQNKGVILIINKCDLIDPSLVLAWQDYFTKEYPKLIVVPFSSMEGRTIRKSNFDVAYQSSLKLIEACQKLVDPKVDLRSWLRKIKSEISGESPEKTQSHHHMSGEESVFSELQDRYKNGVLTLGTIGHPNVGKSSLINALMGKKVVSVSKTPGHTKHFQTIFITKNIKLCDCPGLVFPSLCQKELQVILGSYPVAQVRNPLGPLSYIACRLDLPSILKLNFNENEASEEKLEWTPFLICEAYAKKRGYFVRSRGGRPNVFRAANELLRFTLSGFKNLVIALRPPEYSINKKNYECDLRISEIKMLQATDKPAREGNMNYGDQEIDEESEFEPESKDESETNSDEESNPEEEEDSDSLDTEEEGLKLDVKKSENKFSLLSLEDC